VIGRWPGPDPMPAHHRPNRRRVALRQPKPLRVLVHDEQVPVLSMHPSQEMRQRRDGALELRLETSSRKELTRWILSWAPYVKYWARGTGGSKVRERLRQGAARQHGRQPQVAL